jgi:hypothetical protein
MLPMPNPAIEAIAPATTPATATASSNSVTEDRRYQACYATRLRREHRRRMADHSSPFCE